MKQWKDILRIGSAFIGIIVGAGFASGQEIVQYFTSFGTGGFIGAILATALFAFIGMALVRIGSRLNTTSHKEAVYVIGGRFIGTMIDYVLVFTLFGVGVVMLAGAGASLNQQFGLPSVIGTTLIVLLVFVTGILSVDRVIAVIGIITPFLLFFILIIAIYSISTIDGSWTELESAAKKQPTNLSNWWIAAVNYVSFNTSVGAAMALVMGGAEQNEKTAIWGGLAGGLGLGFLIIIVNGAIFSKIGTVGGLQLPTLGIVNEISPFLGVLMAMILFAMIFNTAISMFFAFSARFMETGTKKFAIFLGLTLVIGYIASFAGFEELVGFFYPLIGYLGLVLFLTLVIAWFRLNQLTNRKKTKNFLN